MGLDRSVFMDQTIDEPLEHMRELVPEGEYQMRVTTLPSTTRRSVHHPQGRNGGHHPPSPVRSARREGQQKLGRDKVTVTFRDLWLDFKPGTSEIDTGPNKNVDLGAIRKALGLTEGAVFAPLRGAGPVPRTCASPQY